MLYGLGIHVGFNFGFLVGGRGSPVGCGVWLVKVWCVISFLKRIYGLILMFQVGLKVSL
jgi:hypothetical protein